MRHCAAYGCTNNSYKKNCEGVSFFGFPLKRKDVLEQWMVKIRRQNFQPREHSALCSDHFTEDCFRYQKFTNLRLLKPGAIPTKFSYTVVEDTPKQLDHEGLNDVIDTQEAASHSEIEELCTSNEVIEKTKETCTATLPLPSSDDNCFPEASVSDVTGNCSTMTAAKKLKKSSLVIPSSSVKNRAHGSTVSKVSQNKNAMTCPATLPLPSNDNCCPAASVSNVKGNCSTKRIAKKIKRSLVIPSSSVKNRAHKSTVSLVSQNKDVVACPSTPSPSSDSELTVSLDSQNEDVMTCPSTPPPSSDDNCCPVSDVLRNSSTTTAATQENTSSVTPPSSVDNSCHESTVSIVSENLSSLMKVVIKNGKIVSGTFTVPSTSANNCFPKPKISSVISCPITASPSSADNCIPEPIIPPVISDPTIVSLPSASNCFPKRIVPSVSQNLSDLTTVAAKRGKEQIIPPVISGPTIISLPSANNCFPKRIVPSVSQNLSALTTVAAQRGTVGSCSVTVSSTDNCQPGGLKTNSNLFRTRKKASSLSKEDMKIQIKLMQSALRQRDKRIQHLQSLLKAKSVFKMPDNALNMQKNAFMKVPCLLIRKRTT